jgi:DNA-directed RNA polymerase subunit RPC12/RpoP
MIKIPETHGIALRKREFKKHSALYHIGLIPNVCLTLAGNRYIMALIECRECGKEVSDQAGACPYCGIKTPSKKKHKRNLVITAVATLFAASVLIGGIIWGYRNLSHATVPPAETGAADKPYQAPMHKPASSAIKQDIPVKEQVVQKDYKEKIREMLDSGQTVREISKKTGMRIDEIRKIKKEKNQDQNTPPN